MQEQHYDPWGLTLAGIEKDGDYPFQFNSGSEKQKDALGQGYYYETDFRDYDPQLGRFRGVDILADQMPGISPYHFSYNNPVSFSDPRGDSPVLVGALVGAGVGGVVGGLISSSNGDGFWRGFAIGAAIGAGAGAGAGALYQSHTAVGQWMRNVIGRWSGTDPAYKFAGVGEDVVAGGGGGGGFAAAAQAGGELLASTGSDLALAQAFGSGGGSGGENCCPDKPDWLKAPERGEKVMDPLPEPKNFLDWLSNLYNNTRTYQGTFGDYDVGSDGRVIGPKPIAGTGPTMMGPGGGITNIRQLYQLAKSPQSKANVH